MNILKLRPLFYLFSLILISASVYSIFAWGFRPSVDFAGGTTWQIQSDLLTSDQISHIFTQNQINLNSVQPDNQQFTLEFENISQDQKQQLESAIIQADPDFQSLQFQTLSPTLGRELIQKTVYAIILSSLFLFLFIGRRFHDSNFGLAAILAMLHDTLILIGSFSILGHFFSAQVDTLFVTAVLTTLSASVHDTVVTFDRIRELKLKNYSTDFYTLSNQAVSETLVRSINNSLTIIFMLLALVILGGDSTRWFAVALLIGAVLGTYSSLGVAVPLLLIFKKRN